MARIDVVIVSYRVRELLLRCLESLQDCPLALSIWVVDNTSNDGSVDAVRSSFPHVRMLALPKNQGFAKANNLAIAASTSPYVLILNPDTEVPRETLPRLLKELEAAPEIAAVGPRILLPDGSLDEACRRSFPRPQDLVYKALGLDRLLPRWFGRYNLRHLPVDQATDVGALVGACMLVRRSVIDQIGLLDERFFLYGEDLDWCKRMTDAGWRLRYEPAVTILHHKRASSRQDPWKRRPEFYNALGLLFEKHIPGWRGRSWRLILGIPRQLQKLTQSLRAHKKV